MTHLPVARHFLLIMMIIFQTLKLSAQAGPGYYEEKWKSVDTLISRKGLTATALSQVNSIYQRAKKEKNDVQLIRSLIYRMYLQTVKLENADLKNIQDLQKELPGMNEPARSILNSMLAESYWNYFQKNRWTIYGRTKTVHFNKEDPATWSLEDFHEKVGKLYLGSLSDEHLLQQTSLTPYDPILTRGNVRFLRPTLYDFLAHRALNYFKNDERDIRKTTSTFEIDDPAAFSGLHDFVRYRFHSTDSASLRFTALLLFQRLLRFHESDAHPDALLDLDVKRIELVNTYAVMEDKDSLYMEALKSITARYENDPAAAGAWYLLAQVYANKAATYDPLNDTSLQYAYLQAKKICEKIAGYKDSSEARSNCQLLLSQILQKSLSLQTEQVNLPGYPFRTLVTYRNQDHIYLRVLPADRKTRQEFLPGSAGIDSWKDLLQIRPIRDWKQDLPDPKDYQQHRTEIRIDSLSPGEYALLASNSQDFSVENSLLGVEFFYVSNITYIYNGPDYFVLHRETGQPLARADVQVWYRYYDTKQRKDQFRMGEHMITDRNGAFNLFPPKTHGNNQFLLEITKGNDHLFMDDESSFDRYYSYPAEISQNDRSDLGKDSFELARLNTFLFTDRSIYRPGQTVFFKGILISKDYDTRQPKIMQGFKTKIILLDADRQRIDSMEVTTSEYGSFHGSFRLPEGLLNGEFQLQDNLTRDFQTISVEEYKRPRFFVGYDSLKGSWQLGDTVTVRATAKAYAGNTIGGASVKYRVVREVRFPYPWRLWRGGRLPDQEAEMIHGETKTDPSGKFTVVFRAVADPSVRKNLDPVFTYRVEVDVTDINGETRSAETSVRAGYKNLELSISLPDQASLVADSLKSVAIHTKNLEGYFLPARVNVVMYRLAGLTRLIRERYWNEQDQFAMQRAEYLKYFPHDEYGHESKPETWARVAKIFDITDTTRPGYHILTSGYPLIPGWYVIEATAKDKSGQEVKDQKYFRLFDAATGRPGSPAYTWEDDQTITVKPGSMVTSRFGSSAENLFVIRLTDRAERGAAREQGEAQRSFDFMTLSNEQKSFSYSIKESDRGGFGLFYAFVKNNRLFLRNQTISVPWDNKDLRISYVSYRDKTLPGGNEKWKMKISGHQSAKVAAEVLTAMYDASLDQFKDHTWVVPPIYPDYAAGFGWRSDANFKDIWFIPAYHLRPKINYYRDIYDQLLVVGSRRSEFNGFIIRSSDMYVSGQKLGFSKNELNAKYDANANYAYKNSVPDTTNIQKVKIQGAGGPLGLQIRRNFNETAFFLPDLQTDSTGSVEFSFTMPEALTRWKWMTFAHTKDLAFGLSEKSVITQKQLMVQPNMPRFLREGDRIDLSAKIANLTDSELTGQVQLQLVDPTTNQSVDGWFQNLEANQYFTVGPGESGPVSFNIQVPFQYGKPLTYRIVATANRSGETFSDGEESMLPVISNRALVTETMPITVRGTGTKKIRFEKLLQSGTSETLNNYALTLEFTGNPSWYVLQALPWIMESPDECSEQAFDRFYANALAGRILGSSPAIREVFDRWRQIPDSAENFLSALGKNQELKTVVLQETPWVMEAKEESQQKKYLATLFDPGRVSAELNNSLQALASMQFPSGGFPWFSGGPDDRFITQYILTGIGRLKKMSAIPAGSEIKINSMVRAALAYLDKLMRSDYEKFLKVNRGGTEFTGPVHIQYLYMRSFYPQIPIPEDVMPAVREVRKEEARSWVKYSRCFQAMAALSMHRAGQGQPARDILASLKENSISDPETGIHWKQNTASYFWYGAPVETQCVLIEAFSEISADSKTVDEMKTWLLTQKRTQAWSTTKATADACYALILQGSQWLSSNPGIRITLGDKEFDSRKEGSTAGTGYFKERIDGPFVKPEMGDISVTVSHPPSTKANPQPAWGAVYWQYFDQLDKVTASNTGLRINKKNFLEKNERGSLVLEPAQDNQILHPGDRVRVRIEIRSDRDMEFVHMKDLRASCLEPVTVLSGYHYQDGLGYYESVRDVSTDFFFDWLPRGTHVFEYPMVVSHTGNFSNGMANIQCMYAPEFSGHSEGIRLNVENQVP